jgi:hypothetical protein
VFREGATSEREKRVPFLSTPCEPNGLPLGESTASVQLDTCASSPISVSMGVLRRAFRASTISLREDDGQI